MLPPKLDTDELEVWLAFWDLNNRSRATTQAGPSGIPLNEITLWLDIHGIQDHYNRLWFYKLIAAMDDTYLHYIREEMRAKMA